MLKGLSWANLAELELHKCSFAARDMTGVNLQDAYLNRVNLSANKLAKADLRGAILTQTGKTASVFELPGYLPSKISALAFSNDEKLLASGSCDGLITVWEVDSGSELYSFQSFAGIVRSLAFSSGNRSLISGSEGGFRYEAMLEDTAYENNEAAGIAYVWSLVTGEFITGLVSRGAPVRAIQFSPDGRVVAGITGSSVVLWKVDWE